jgi:hypothetical protein
MHNQIDELDELDLHEECKNQCRSSIILQYIDRYPESLSKIDMSGYLPLHLLLMNRSLAVQDILAMIEKHPDALKHHCRLQYPLHIECMKQCRSVILAKCVELYPEALTKADWLNYLPLHKLLWNESSTVEDALMMIDKYPAALERRDFDGYFPVHIECKVLCRSAIISKCIELYPQAFDEFVIRLVIMKVNHHKNFRHYAPVLSLVFTGRPMSLYTHHANLKEDIRKLPDTRRRILNLLPRRVFTPTHESDYRDLNWQPRAAMMMLLSQMKIQLHSRQQQRASLNGNTDAVGLA